MNKMCCASNFIESRHPLQLESAYGYYNVKY